MINKELGDRLVMAVRAQEQPRTIPAMDMRPGDRVVLTCKDGRERFCEVKAARRAVLHGYDMHVTYAATGIDDETQTLPLGAPVLLLQDGGAYNGARLGGA